MTTLDPLTSGDREEARNTIGTHVHDVTPSVREKLAEI